METEADPCTVCGGTDSKLIDGFYYCIECGTQNTNVQETVLEEKLLANGEAANKVKKRIRLQNDDGVDMSDEWYKWHGWNFIMSGIADDMIALGAKPSFKVKLLWIWTRYIKKFQDKAEMSMKKTSGDSKNQTELVSFMAEEEDNNIMDEEKDIPEESKKKPARRIKKCDPINMFTKNIILAMLYLALNLDESEIQLSHLHKLVKENRLKLVILSRFLPADVSVKKIPGFCSLTKGRLLSIPQLRSHALSLLIALDLGSPKVPDMKKIVDNFLTELCLPNDFKLLVYALMHYRKCNYLDIDPRTKKTLFWLPDYEGIAMSYILVGLKMCFGLDGRYEMKLSDVVEKINEEGNFPKSYRIGKYSEPSDRLFSFRDWFTYLHFRKFMLCKYNFHMAIRYLSDIDDYSYMEHYDELSDNRDPLLPHKISMEIIDRIPEENHTGVLPKELFLPTLTPLNDYTDIIIEHIQDPEVKLLLSEDFKRYSLKYACENLELINSDMENIIKGVTENDKTTNNVIVGTLKIKQMNTDMVYVKNCENRNWLKTNPPTIEHMTCVESEDEEEEQMKTNGDKDSDHGYDSENTLKDKHSDCATDNNVCDSNETEVLEDDDHPDEGDNRRIIIEEDDEKNIFDDTFEELDFKEECEMNIDDLQINGDDYDDCERQIPSNDIPDEDFDRRSDVSDDCGPTFNPETFDRDSTIKELIFFTCKKYKIPIPTDYKTKQVVERKGRIFGASKTAKRPKRTFEEGQVSVQEILSNYRNQVQTDFVTRAQQEMNLAVRNFELENQQNNHLQTSVLEGSADIISGSDTPMVQSDINSTVGPVDGHDSNADITNQKEINDQTEEINENLENMLFGDIEMKFDDVVPKGDPKYDENVYDVKQLYIKVKEHEKLDESKFNMEDDPEIDEIIFKDSIGESDSSEKVKEESDSEEEIPLSEIKESKQLIEKIYYEDEKYEQLIKKQNIPEIKYWIRHYPRKFMWRSVNIYAEFTKELNENTSPNFCYIIHECATMLGCSSFALYKHMQFLENEMIAKSKYLRKRKVQKRKSR